MSRLRLYVGRTRRRIGQRVERVTAPALDRLRWGERTILMTPPTGLRLGNLLYVWLQAHRRSRAGCPTLALEARAMGPWLTAFPGLSTLTITPRYVQFRDRREWDPAWLYQRFGIDFATDDLTAFIRDAIAPHVAPDRTGMLVINIRRGDYYAEHAGKYSFDQAGYLRVALARAGSADRVLVVSDDAEWCRSNLDALIRSHAPIVDYADPEPLANFLAVAGASRIIGTNSTFTYWAAYVAGVIHPDAEVIMPRFHARMPHTTDAHQLDPRWTVIEGFH